MEALFIGALPDEVHSIHTSLYCHDTEDMKCLFCLFFLNKGLHTS